MDLDLKVENHGEEDHQSNMTVHVLVSLIVFLFFIVTLAIPLIELRQRMDFESWPLVDATILESGWDTREERFRRYDDHVYTDKPIFQRQIRLLYQYRFEGEVYTGTRFRQDPKDFRFPPEIQIKMSQEVPGYPVGAVVKAHVNPRDPQEAYLKGPYDEFDHSKFLWPSLLLLILLILIPGLFGYDLFAGRERAPG